MLLQVTDIIFLCGSLNTLYHQEWYKAWLYLKGKWKFFFYFYFILFLNFTILYWFYQISKWICHRYTCVPHPEPSSLFPPHTILLGRPSAPAPSIQYRASNLDWHAVEKEMATHSSVLAWRIPGMGEPDGLPSMGSHRVRHDWSDLAAAAAAYRVK